VLVDGRLILPSGNSNYSEINDPEIDSLIDDAKKQTDPNKVADIYGQINKKVMDHASLVPFVYDKALNYRNPRMTNVYVSKYWGMWDFPAMGTGGK
jgi:peptide/nickel transport system substrate-binding protein